MRNLAERVDQREKIEAAKAAKVIENTPPAEPVLVVLKSDGDADLHKVRFAADHHVKLPEGRESLAR